MSLLAPACSALRRDPVYRKAKHFIETEALFEGLQHIDIALSAGADSVALTAILVAYVEQTPRAPSLRAHHVQHGLRQDDQLDAACAHQVAESFGLELIVSQVQLGGAQSNIEARCREARYDALLKASQSLAQERGLDLHAFALALGQHGDENLETALWRLGRGCCTASLALAWRRQIQGLWRLRPLLLHGKAELYAFLQKFQLPWVEDSSNQSQRFLRNRLRQQVLPALKAQSPSTDTLYRSLIQIKREAIALESLIENLVQRLPCFANSLFCPQTLWEKLDANAQIEILKAMVKRLTPGHSLEAQCLERSRACLRLRKESWQRQGDAKVYFQWSRDGLSLSLREAKLGTSERLELNLPCFRQRLSELFEISVLPLKLESYPPNGQLQLVLKRQGLSPALKICPAQNFSHIDDSEGRTRKVRECLRSQGLPPTWREAWPVLCDDEGPLWILAGARTERAQRPKAQDEALLINLRPLQELPLKQA